ncbi:MAG: hypothetical protein ACYC61_04105 [Isosphaeraceae bacterium]
MTPARSGTDVVLRAIAVMISGQYPKHQWRPNPDGQTRTIDEAVAIARRFGVRIPEDVEFFVDELGDLDERTTARGPLVSKIAGEVVTRPDLVHDITGKVPFRIRPDILTSDEAIVAVLAHEMFELERLRLLPRRGISIEEFGGHTSPGNPGNLHDQAWDLADVLVERMRGEARS